MSTSDQNTDLATSAGKVLIVWMSTITGMTVTEWAAVFACVYTALQIIVLVRDKFIRKDSK